MRTRNIFICFVLVLIIVISLIACAQEEKTGSNENKEDVGKEVKNTEYNLHALIESNKTLLATTELVSSVPFPTTGNADQCQGGYTDGKYFYQAFLRPDIQSGEVENEVIIVKYDMETETVVKESEILKLNHCNDITYNPKVEKLIICNATGRKNIVSIMNPDTLELDGEVDLGFEIFSINYNEKRNQYVVGIAGGQSFRLLDENFQTIGEIYDPTTRTVGYTTQGNCADDEYIYFLLYNNNVINVYDWNGNFVSWIKLDIPNNIEPENISVVGNTFYIGAVGSPHRVYKVESIKPEE